METKLYQTAKEKITIVYLSGRISGIDFKDAIMNFEYAKIDVKNLFPICVVLNPLTVRPFLGIKKWLFYMIADISKQRKCTHTAMLSNWMDSKGAVVEYFFAKFIFKQTIIFL